MTETSSTNRRSSPPVEQISEKINTVASPHSSCTNEYKGKKIKYEHEQHNHQDMSYCAKPPMIEDDCEAFGHSVAAQLRQMSRMQKLIAQRLISEICFRGQVNALQISTTFTPQINPLQQYQLSPFSNPIRTNTNPNINYNGSAENAMQYNAVQQQTRIPANIALSSNIQDQAPNPMNNFQHSNQVLPPSYVNSMVNASESMK